MRILFIVSLLMFGMLSAEAQKKKKSKKEKQEAKTEEAVPGEVIFEEPMPVVEEIMMAVEEEPREISTSNLRDENGPFYMYDTYSTKDVAVVYQGSGYDNRQYGLLKISTQSLLTPLIFESLSGHFNQSDFATVSINGKYGTINSKGEIGIPCLYERFSNFFIDEQIYFIATINGNYGVVTETNETLIPFEYASLSKIYNLNPYLLAKVGQKMGVLDPISKKTILPFEFDEIEVFSSNILRVKKDNQYNFLDATGKVILSKWYSSLALHDDNMLIARYEGKEGIIDLTEKILIPFIYDKIEKSYMEGSPSYLIQKNGKYGLLGKDGVLIIPALYDNLRSFSSGTTLLATRDNKKGLITKEGKIVLPIEYDEVERSDRNILIKKNGKFGLLDKDMQPVFPNQYEDIQQMNFDGGYNPTYYLASKNGKKGIIDLNGKTVIDFSYDNIIPHSNSYRPVYKLPLICIKNGKYGMIDLNNKVIVPFDYDHLLPLNSFLLIVGKKNKFGVVEIYNPTTQTLPIEYSFITYKQGNNLIAYKDKFVRFKVSGNKVTPIE